MTGSSTLWVQFFQTVLPYFGALCVAILSTATLAVYTWAQQRGLQRQVDKQGGGGRAATVVAVGTPTAAGGRPALNVPAWNQLDDPLPDMTQDPYATVDCGEECVSMAVAACSGPSLPAYILRSLLGTGAGHSGTTEDQLVYLLGLLKIPSHKRLCDPETAWIEWQHSYNAGFLVIALGYWVTLGYPHWILIRQTTDNAIQFNDPWGGMARILDKATAQKLFLGRYVHLDSAVTGLAATPPS